MKLRGFDITNNRNGWVCDCCFLVTTAESFTDEEHTVRAWDRFIPLAILRSYWLAKTTAMRMKAKPGQREAKGWAT